MAARSRRVCQRPPALSFLSSENTFRSAYQARLADRGTISATRARAPLSELAGSPGYGGEKIPRQAGFAFKAGKIILPA